MMTKKIYSGEEESNFFPGMYIYTVKFLGKG